MALDQVTYLNNNGEKTLLPYKMRRVAPPNAEIVDNIPFYAEMELIEDVLYDKPQLYNKQLRTSYSVSDKYLVKLLRQGRFTGTKITGTWQVAAQGSFIYIKLIN